MTEELKNVVKGRKRLIEEKLRRQEQILALQAEIEKLDFALGLILEKSDD